MSYDNGRALKDNIQNRASYCSLIGALLSQSPGSNVIEITAHQFSTRKQTYIYYKALVNCRGFNKFYSKQLVL